jgi:hypothetical protein
MGKVLVEEELGDEDGPIRIPQWAKNLSIPATKGKSFVKQRGSYSSSFQESDGKRENVLLCSNININAVCYKYVLWDQILRLSRTGYSSEVNCILYIMVFYRRKMQFYPGSALMPDPKKLD